MSDFTTDQLATLVATVDEGSFDAAAARLHVTPSAVSQRIKALERAAGQVLLQRTAPILPTDAGQTVLRYARQSALLGASLERELQHTSRIDGALSLPIAVNADSLATWFLPALATFQGRNDVVFDLRRSDQRLTADMLRRGEVVAAVTSVAEPVQGATSSPLGAMRYLPVCSPTFVESFLNGVAAVGRLAHAPVVDFDRADRLQQSMCRDAVGSNARAPRHFVPDSTDFARAIIAGLGWGMLPEQQCAAELEDGTLVRLGGAHDAVVPLYWQRWSIPSIVLDEVTDAVQQTAATALRRAVRN